MVASLISRDTLSIRPKLHAISKTLYKVNRMTLQQVGAARTAYAYDGDGLRRRLVTSAGTTYVWDGTDYL